MWLSDSFGRNSNCNKSRSHIRIQDLGSNITIIAPHGGLIEPRTSLITELIAGDIYNYYSFEGIKEKRNKGVQLEISRGLRDDLKKLSSISTAIQNVLNSVKGHN
ncbi:MAG: poly-gamma-glutamate hydrolase family protein [Deltaproteobacteria bacterium]|nr:poly-gamma-glutamate hydrolase family protein [Candidatus Desulfobacula maris]MBL6992886.1 poly-gamma-glutamate hydrolase family protein [Desulfobacula sp.]